MEKRYTFMAEVIAIGDLWELLTVIYDGEKELLKRGATISDHDYNSLMDGGDACLCLPDGWCCDSSECDGKYYISGDCYRVED